MTSRGGVALLWGSAAGAACGLVACGFVGCEKSVEQACEDLAAQACHRYATCAPFLMRTTYGGEETCRERAAARCRPLPELEGATVGVSDIEACASAYPVASCDDLLLGAPPVECRFAGLETNGARCAAGAQCASSFCETGVDGSCGQCKAVRKEGQSCSKGGSACDRGLYCGASECRRLGREGEMCSAAAPCNPRYACKEGVCEAPAGPGEPCGVDRACDALLGLVCEASSGTCAEMPVASVGEACGDGEEGGAVAVCAAGARCAERGECVGRRDVGQMCVTLEDSSNTCKVGLMCVGGVCSEDYPACW